MFPELTNQVVEIFRLICKAENIDLPPQMSGATSLGELGLNSLLFIRIIVRLEIVFDVDFDDESVSVGTFKTMNDVVKYIESKQN